MSLHTFSAPQNAVLARISEGATIQQAADAAGVHRNTVLNWRRSSAPFRESWEAIHYEQALHWREQALPLAPVAIDSIRNLLEDPETKPALRLRAALAVYKIASTPPPTQPERARKTDWDSILGIPPLNAFQHVDVAGFLDEQSNDDLVAALERRIQKDPSLLKAANTEEDEKTVVPSEPLHNRAQSRTTEPRKAGDPGAPAPKSMHNDAQSAPKTGRNQPCPCHSGRKFKHCCLGKALRAAA